jgi:hypothetical protein
MRIAAFLVLLVAGIHSAAATEAAAPDAGKPAIAAVLRDFGLFGAWAVNCALPATPANPHVSIVETQPGVVVERHELGPEYETNSYSVTAAAPVSTTRVSLDVVFKPGADGEQRQRLILRVEHDTRRTMYNRIEHGAVLVKDGIVVGHGVHTPVLHKCG